MVHCPKCNATLPDGAYNCQFCGTQFAPVPQSRGYTGGKPNWIWPAYYGVAAYWMLSGLASALEAILQSKGGPNIFALIIAVLNFGFGLGLALRIELIRGITNVFCFINILFGLFGLAGSFLLTAIVGWLGLLIMGQTALSIATSGAMIYLLGETD